jgi:4-aminobutyrate--pyruvate transaminase
MNRTPRQLKDLTHLLHGYTDLSGHQQNGPVVITRGEGIHIFDEQGKAYIEAASGMWCAAFGFSDEELIAAAERQLRILPYYHTLASRSVNPAIDLAEQLADIVPIENARIHFAVSGSEANDFLIKFLYYYNNSTGRPQKKKVISRHNGYHGATMAATSMSGLAANHARFDMPLPGFLHTSNPHYYRYGRSGETPDEFSGRMAQDLENLILQEGPDTVMAFMVEPISGGAGVIIPPDEYFPAIHRVLERYDIMMLADEVITGFGRTGKMFGCETMGVKPDALTMAKGLSAAYQPISAIAISDEIYRGLVSGSDDQGHYFAHGATYSGHPVAAAVGVKVLELFESRKMLDHVNKVSATFGKRLELVARHELVGEVRYRGLLGAIELVEDKSTRASFDPALKVSARLKGDCERHGVILRTAPAGDSVALCPPLIITTDQINELFDRIELGLADTANNIRKQSGL